MNSTVVLPLTGLQEEGVGDTEGDEEAVPAEVGQSEDEPIQSKVRTHTQTRCAWLNVQGLW